MENELHRIVTVGPAFPFKGGIAQYTSLLLKALAKKYDVTCVSYKLMYPKILYPGNEQRDSSNEYLRYDKTDFLINTINPFSYISAARAIKELNPDLIIFHWWHPFFGPAYYSMMTQLRKKFKIIICCNNVLPHDKFPFSRFITKSVLTKAHGFLVHSYQEADDLKQIVPQAIFEKNVCPLIDVSPPTLLTKDTARTELGISRDVPVLLFFGFVRPYKGLKHLLQALPMIKKAYPGVKLLIVGDFYEQKDSYLDIIRTIGIEDNVVIFDNYIPDKEISKYFIAADLTVLPYESATTSGVIPISYRYQRPVVATNVGGLPEAVADGETGYLVEAMNSDKIASAILRYFDERESIPFEENMEKISSLYSWDRIVEKVENIWRRI